jgi:transcriptional regulator with XRE-family HTH domain
MKLRLDGHARAEPHGCTLWVRIGRRLQTRRTELGLTIEGAARELGIERRSYEAIEEGAEHVPAVLLTQIAELFRVRVFWFFEDIAFGDEDVQEVAPRPKGTYRVATVEERVDFLADSFRRLDFEGQQHLLAIASALSRNGGKGRTG